MKKTPLASIISLIVAGMILSACSAGGSASLEGTSWRLVSYGPTGKQNPAAPGIETRLEFGGDGQVSGNMGCNGFGGEYKVKDGKIIFGNLMSTLMACDEPRMTQESTAFQVMNGTVDYKVDGDTLTIYAANGALALTLARK